MTIENRITRLFRDRQDKLLAVFVTAGYPTLGDTVEVCRCLAEAGADLIEVGFPFSDSLVDGPTIQVCNQQSLAAGMTLDLYFEQLAEIRRVVSVPLIVMSCVNPLLRMGMEAFCSRCQQAGVDGAIIADLPVEEYQREYHAFFEKAALSNICLVTQHTPDARIRMIDSVSSGFIYVVSSDSTTGSRLADGGEHERYFERLAGMQLTNPLMVGFGISDHATFERAARHTRGAIVGSAFLRALEGSANLRETITSFVHQLKGTA